MKKIIRLGLINLTYPMYVSESLQDENVVAEKVQNLAGGVIIHERLLNSSSKNITLQSRDNGWQKESFEEIKTLANNSFGQNVEIEYADNTTEIVRFRYEDQAVSFEPLGHEGTGWYVGQINLAKI